MAPNILAMVQSFNQLALLVPTEVLGERTPQQRAKVISAYIQVR
jgi:RecG-like helicase